MAPPGAAVKPVLEKERSGEMIRVTVEVREGAASRRVRATASSIERALELAGGSKPGREVRVLLPIDPEDFFAGDAAPAIPELMGGSDETP